MSNLDMTAMYAMHDALRREPTHMARVTAKTGDEPRRILRRAAGWHLFKKSLHIHHTAEDDALWPALRQSLADRQDDLVQRTATVQQWAHFGQVHGQRIRPDAPRLIPWLLEGADEQTMVTMLAPLPEPVRAAYAAEWQPAYACLDRWSAES